jgi:hypothetical protein
MGRFGFVVKCFYKCLIVVHGYFWRVLEFIGVFCWYLNCILVFMRSERSEETMVFLFFVLFKAVLIMAYIYG